MGLCGMAVDRHLRWMLQTIMRKRGLDQRGLAELLGVSQPLVSMWIRGRRQPTSVRYEQVALEFEKVRQSFTAGRITSF